MIVRIARKEGKSNLEGQARELPRWLGHHNVNNRETDPKRKRNSEALFVSCQKRHHQVTDTIRKLTGTPTSPE
jgi:hypothetical protein